MPIDDVVYYLDTDASDIGLGAVLSQMQDGVERPIAYASRSLNNAERIYCTTRKELLAVVYGLKQYRQYLLGRPFVIRTDHSSLQWLRRTPEPIAQQARWLAFIEQFQYSIEHRPGNRHINADALSRLPHPCKQCSHCDDDSEETVVNSIDDDTPVKSLVRSIVIDLMIRRPDLKSVDSVRVRGIATSDITTDVVADSAGKSIAEMQSNDPSIGEFVKLLVQYSEQPSIDTLRLSSETKKFFGVSGLDTS